MNLFRSWFHPPKPVGACLRLGETTIDIQNRLRYVGRREGLRMWEVHLSYEEMRALNNGQLAFICHMIPPRTSVNFRGRP